MTDRGFGEDVALVHFCAFALEDNKMKTWTLCLFGDIDGPYHDSYPTRDDAIAAAVAVLTASECDNGTPFYVAQARPPKVDFGQRDFPELLAFDCEEDFGGESAVDWPAFTPTDEQTADLTASIEAAFNAWLERHNMVPTWRVIEAPERLTLGAAREMAK